MDMYIRVKRSKSTYFIRCKPSDKIIDIKHKLQEIIDQPVNDQRFVLRGTGEILEHTKTLADQKMLMSLRRSALLGQTASTSARMQMVPIGEN